MHRAHVLSRASRLPVAWTPAHRSPERPVSKRVRRWVGAHNRKVKREGGCKIRVCGLPVKAPWLNPIEPKWLHGKRAIVEPTRKLTAAEVKQRVHEHYHCEPHESLTQKAA